MPHGSRDKSKLNYKLEAYTKLISYLVRLKNKKVILLGDFNISHEEIDLANPKQNKNNIMFTSEERKSLDLLIKQDFIDVFRHFNNNVQKFSWWPYYRNLRERNIGWRIDYTFVSSNLLENVNKSDILIGIKGSDHCPIEVDIK
jgi:exodeoxyribonuclease-3